jgi:macrolide transport system ATP-binding/permease protein
MITRWNVSDTRRWRKNLPAPVPNKRSLFRVSGTVMKPFRVAFAFAARFRAWSETFIQDFRFGARILRKSPGFAITAILTLSLGIAAAVAIFGFVDSALLQPLPYPDSTRLMGVFETSPLSGQRMGYSYHNYLDMDRANTVFASTAAYDSSKDFVLTDSEGAHEVNGVGVTGKFFRILGVTPILGDVFAPDSASEDLLAAPSTVVLSYAAWQTWFGGSPDVLGKTVTLNGDSYTVIGVLPRDFQFARTGATEFWTTLYPFAGDSCKLSRGCATTGVIATLKNGVSLEQALADVQAIAGREAKEHPDPDRNRSANVVPLSQVILGTIQPILLTLLGGAVLLLLIAYTNVTGLFLARSENRRREFAVRVSLGADRGRLLQQFITEAFVIVAASSALGLFAATFAQQMLLKLIPARMLDSMPYLLGAAWNWHKAIFAGALVLIAWALLTITPVLRLPFGSVRAGLAEGNRAATGMVWRHLGARLVVLELVTTMVLLSGAGLLTKSFYELLQVDVGFVSAHVATLSIVSPNAKYSTRDQALALQQEIFRRLLSIPGITAAGTVRDLPLSGVGSTQIGFVGRPSLGVNNEVGHQVISAEYLSVLEARLLRGRYFNENDTTTTPLVAIINQTLARRYFSGQDPIGKQFFYHAHDIKREGSQPPIQVVGVIADVKEDALDQPAAPVIYTPFDQGPDPSFSIAVRASQEAGPALPSMITAIHAIDPEIVASNATTMPEIIQNSSAAYWHRISAWLVGGSAALALALSIVGLYGVIAYSVSQRTREIGVRMALGATPTSVYQLVLSEAGRLTLIGILIGVPGSIAAATFMRSLLFGVRVWDLSILAAISVVLIASALLASYIPARRAASVNPVEALRAE